MKIKYLLLFLFVCAKLKAQNNLNATEVEFYGFAMTDVGYNFNQLNPNWADVARPSQLPTFKNQFWTNGNIYFSVRQSRFGTKATVDTKKGKMKFWFEWELFGVGVDAGQTTFRIRHAYGELGSIGIGQTNSPFMDMDVFPNSLEYWGPSGMVFFRNISIRYMPVRGLSKLTFALERPGASSDQGIYKDRIELTNVKSRFPLPDFSAEYRSGHNWGYIELAGMLRYIKWEDQNNFPVINLSGSAVGWGLNLSSNVKLNKSSVLKSAFIYGAGVENYMNDGPVDISIKNQFGNSRAPIKGVALPLFGLTAFLDHDWNDKFSSTIGYSMVKVNNTDAQSANSLKKGSYALTNLLYKPVENVLTGVELQWIERKNYIDNGFDSHSIKIQFSFKYSFSQFFNKSK